MIRSPLALLLVLLAAHPAAAQETPLDRYVRDGLRQNLSLQAHRFDLAASRRDADEARGAFYPSVSLEARYTRAGGGRTIDFPVGDLLNPAYGALNDLLDAPGGAFPVIENEQFSLLRTREQETKVRLVQPLFQPALRYNARIRTYLADAEAASVDAARRTLVADVKTAYYAYLQADRVAEIYEATHTLVTENLRVNERLSANGKVTRDAVYRARAEVSAVEQQWAEARTQRDLSAAHFNVLLNRPLDAPIEPTPLGALLDATEIPDPGLSQAPSLAAWQDRALGRREELTRLGYTAEALDANLRLARSAYLPNVSFVLDYGIQGSGYALSGDSDFRSASVVMSWNLFDGFQDRARVEQVRLQRQALDVQQDALAQQIRLQVRDAYAQVAVARRSIKAAEDQLRSARQSFRLVARKVEEGMAPPIDFIDARTALTRAELNLAVTRFTLLMRHAALERTAALYPL